MMTSYLEQAREKAGKKRHPILYSWTVGSDTWTVAVTPIVRERFRIQLKSFFMLLAALTFGVGLSFLVGRGEAGLLLSVVMIIYGLVSWIVYLNSRSAILFPPKRTFFLTPYGFFNGYEYICRVRTYDIDVRERRVFLLGYTFTGGMTPGSGSWKELEMLLMWDRNEDQAQILGKVRQLVLREGE